MENTEFRSKFLTEFTIVHSGFETDRGAYGTIFKVKEKQNGILDNDEYEYDPRVFSVVKVLEVKSQALERIMREVDILKKLDHPSVIKILDSWVESPPPDFKYPFFHPNSNATQFIFQRMEYGDLKSLRHCMRSGWAALRISYTIIYQIAEALAYLHAKGVIHRDLKPENVVFATDSWGTTCTAKIVDFGLATEQGDRDRSGYTSRIGTDGYISPEVVVPGGKYDDKVDIFALGVMFSELVVNSTKDYGGDAGKVFANYLTGEGNYPFNPRKFQSEHPTLMDETQATRASQMTHPDPSRRLSASEVVSTFNKLKKSNFFTASIPTFDPSPSELKIIGKPNRLFSSKTLSRYPFKPNPLLVTHAILKYIKFSPGWVLSYLKDFPNLEYLELVLENFDKDFPPIFGNDLDPSDYPAVTPDSHRTHPKLKTFIFQQLNYSESQRNNAFMNQTKLKTILFFIPVPVYLNQIWENRMLLDIQCGSHVSVNIDVEKSHFYLNGPATSHLLSVLEHIPFKTVSVQNLSSVSLLGTAVVEFRMAMCEQIEAISLSSVFQNVTNLTITNTKVMNYDSGKIFMGLQHLEELSYEGEMYLEELGTLPEFSLDHLPPNLKKLKLHTVFIVLPVSEKKLIKLEKLSCSNCLLPFDFVPSYPTSFRVKHLAIYNNLKFQPNFELLKSIFETEVWESITFTRFNWAVPEVEKNQELQEFATDLIAIQFHQCKIPFGASNLRFIKDIKEEESQGLIGINVVQLKSEMEAEAEDIASGTRHINQKIAARYRSPNDTEGGTQPNQSKFYFNGIEGKPLTSVPIGGHNFDKVPGLTNKSIKEAIIKNATIENISMQLLGCRQLETLILENIRWTQMSGVFKTVLPSLTTFKYFEDVEGRYLNSQKLSAILFFCKNGYDSLWKSNLEILISIRSQRNLDLSHTLGQVTLQKIQGATEVLDKIGLDTRVSSLVIHDCDVPISLIPSHLTSLNLVHVTGIKFLDIINVRGGFPNLSRLYYEASRKDQKFPIEDLSLSSIPPNLDTVMIGGVAITTLAEVRCRNLTLKNCLLPHNFSKGYPSLFKVEKLLFVAGNMGFINYDEIAPLFEENKECDLRWVAVEWFCSEVDYLFYFNLDTRQRFKIHVSNRQLIKNMKIAKLLQESGIEMRNGHLSRFVLERVPKGTWRGISLDQSDPDNNRAICNEISGVSMICQ